MNETVPKANLFPARMTIPPGITAIQIGRRNLQIKARRQRLLVTV